MRRLLTLSEQFSCGRTSLIFRTALLICFGGPDGQRKRSSIMRQRYNLSLTTYLHVLT